MPLTIPSALLAAIREGRAVLFLGAGASRGGMDANRKLIPDARELADLLATTFLGPGYEGMDLRSTYDLACNQRDVGTVQKFIFEIFNPFQPTDFHRLIPTFAWAGIASTNYDLIIERAYKVAHDALQKVIPNVKDGDGSTDQLAPKNVLYVKLHGCITRYGETSPPLIASTEQLIAFRKGREGQFSTFLEWAKTKTLIFCGYSFLDSNLRILFDEIIKEGDNRPRHYIINKGVRPAEIDYWQDRRVTALDATFQDFLEALDGQLDKKTRALGVLAAEPSTKTSFTRFKTVSNVPESSELVHYLASFVEHIGPEIDAPLIEPSKFYSGFDLGWSPIQGDLDVRLPIVDDVLRDHVVPTPSEKLPIVLIKGHAGSGNRSTSDTLAPVTASVTQNDEILLFSRIAIITNDRRSLATRYLRFPSLSNNECVMPPSSSLSGRKREQTWLTRRKNREQNTAFCSRIRRSRE